MVSFCLLVRNVLYHCCSTLSILNIININKKCFVFIPFIYLINSKLLTIHFYLRRLSDVLKRKKPPKRSLGRKCKNSEESPTEAPPKGSSAVGNKSSSRAKSAGIALYYLSYHAYKTIQNNNVITLSCYIISDDYSYFPLTKKF